MLQALREIDVDGCVGGRDLHHLRRRRVNRQRGLQRLRRADPKLSDHAGQDTLQSADAGLRGA